MGEVKSDNIEEFWLFGYGYEKALRATLMPTND